MGQFGLITVALIHGMLCALSAAADQPQTLPPPRWHVSLSPLFSNHPDDTRITSARDVILISHYPAVIAVDRTSGRELWRRMEADAETVEVPRTRTGWQLLSFAAVNGVGPIALLLKIHESTRRDRTFPSGERSTADYSEEALNATTGQLLWRSPL